MLSRRSFFTGVAATATGAAVLSRPASPRLSSRRRPDKAEDLTHDLVETFPTYFGGQQFFIEQKNTTSRKTPSTSTNGGILEHTGTHIDAPLHFTADGKGVGELPVEDLVAPLVVIDIRAKADANADAEVTPDDIKAWTDQNGELPQGAIVAMLSGWGAHVATDKFRNPAPTARQCTFPAFTSRR